VPIVVAGALLMTITVALWPTRDVLELHDRPVGPLGHPQPAAHVGGGSTR
jgi:hypothetical protein